MTSWLIAVVCFLDYLTGSELSFSVFYLAPISLAAWHGGRRAGILASIVSTIAWSWVDFGGKHYPHIAYLFWEAGIRFSFFSVVALLLVTLRRGKDNLEQTVHERTRQLEQALRDFKAEAEQRHIAEQARRQAEEEVLQAAERELRRIGQDLHDSVQGNLVGLQMMLARLKSQTNLSASDLGSQVDHLSNVVADTIAQTRQLAASCSPANLMEDGLHPALKKLAETTASLFGKPCEYQGDPGVKPPQGSVSHLYYIAREAVANALKHAKATSILIVLDRRGDQIVLSIQDDGIGMTADIASAAGMGFKTMSYRTAIIGGRLDVKSRPGGGTIIECSVPAGNAADR